MIIARHISGKIGNFRGYVRTFLLVIYLVIPWLTWNQRPAILLDIADRKFYFPGIVIWPQEFYFLLLLILLLGLSLFLFTTLFGRIWCGWACPQTIYTEFFDWIGRLILPKKFGKRSAKLYHKIIVHAFWILTSAFITFHFIAYFVGTREMLHSFFEEGLKITQTSVWPYFFIIITALFYLDLGIFREHFCIYVCPYARFQSVMLDRDSIVIAYDSHRGEPRRQSGQNIIKAGSLAKQEKHGDCTACNMCVLVCPTGIDIREGLQVSCINCGHCIDACVKEMGKHSKETLVGFSSTNYSENRTPTKFIRTRTIVYSALMTLVTAVFLLLFFYRTPINVSLQRDRNIQPLIAAGTVQNYYEIKIANMGESPSKYRINTDIIDEHKDVILNFEQLTGENPVSIMPNEIKSVRLILRGKVNNSEKIHYRLLDIRVSVEDINNPSDIVFKKSLFTIPDEKNK
ncbi:MAG: cytochrome c oxidase accessory protein CcoG [Spirochaetia bacterium]|nr:cytochrome c oxidase accessory protein CcoG [Spirochaetia bacterium]